MIEDKLDKVILLLEKILHELEKSNRVSRTGLR